MHLQPLKKSHGLYLEKRTIKEANEEVDRQFN